MANQQRPSERESYTNGLAKDTDITATATKMVTGHPELQGYLLLAAGIILLLFSLGFLAVVKWVIVAASVIMILWGAVKSNIIERTSNFIQRMRSR